MGIKYNDADDIEHDFEEEAGAGGTTRPVHGLSASIVAIFSAIKSAVEGTLAVADSVVAGKLDTLHTDLGTVLAGYLDGLEGLVDTVETKLQTIADNQLPPSGGLQTGQNTDIDTGAAEQFSSQALTHGMHIKNISAAGQAIYYGPTSGVTASTGFRLDPGETSPWIPCTNANQVYMLPSADNAAACYSGY